MKVGPFAVARAVAGVVVAGRLVAGGRSQPSVAPAVRADRAISVVVPARDEARRIGPLLDAVIGAPGVSEVVVVDDESSDATAATASAAGARVVTGRARPAGWAGKTWALQQGLDAASGDWVVTLDADTRPDPRLPVSLVARMAADDIDLLTVGARFECPTGPARWLHASMLTTLVYRFGPPGGTRRRESARLLANGQCMAIRRVELLAAGGFALVADSVVEDVAIARRLAAIGWRVEMLDASDLLTVRMYESLAETWRGWGRSLGLPGIEPVGRRVADVVLLGLTMPVPLLRVVAGVADPIDAGLLALRVGTLAGTRRAYTRRGLAYWMSPFADGAALAALALGVLRRDQRWRGRSYRV